MTWRDLLNKDPIPWLLEDDEQNPGVRYFALKDLMDAAENDQEFLDAKDKVMQTGPVPLILAAQQPQGYWEKPGTGYLPKYTSTVWQVILLAQLGADGTHPQIVKACDYILDNARFTHGGFSITGTQMGNVHCLQGNLVNALVHLGFLEDERLKSAMDWMVRSVIGEEIASREEKDAPVHFIKSGISGPGFLCSANNMKPCAWGAIKVMMALGAIQKDYLTQSIQDAIQMGLHFLLSVDPLTAEYPTFNENQKPSRSWQKLGFPIFYVMDILQNIDVLTRFLPKEDKRLKNAVDWLLQKQDNNGCWNMEYSYNGKMWVEIEGKGKPSKWITLRACRVFKQYYG